MGFGRVGFGMGWVWFGFGMGWVWYGLEIYILLIYMVTRLQNYRTYRLLALFRKGLIERKGFFWSSIVAFQ